MLGGSAMDDFSYNSGTGHKGLFAIPVISFGSGESFGFNCSLFRPVLGLAKILTCLYVVYYTFLSSLSVFTQKKKTHNKTKSSANQAALSLSTLTSILAAVLMNPRSVFTSLNHSQAEQLLVQSIKQKTNISLKDVLAVLSIRSSRSPNGYFLKSMYLRRISETLQNHSSRSNDIILVLSQLIAKFVVNPLGQRYWKQASRKANSVSQKGSKDSSNVIVLARLLKCFQYADVDLRKINVVYDYRAGLIRLVAIYLCEQLTVKAEKCMIRSLALEDKLEERAEATDEASSEDEDEEEVEVEVVERHASTVAEIKGEIIASRNKCETSLKLLSQFYDTIPMELKLKGAILQYFLHPDDGEQLAKCFNLAKGLGQLSVKFEMKLALTCCALEYKLIKTPSDYGSLISWMSKLRLPSFTNNFQGGSQLSLFGFVSLLNVFSVLSYNTLECLDKAEREEDAGDSSSVNSEFSASLAEDSGDEDRLELETEVPKINFKLLNVVANMRIFAGNNRHISELGLDDDLRNQVIDGLVGYISHLNGF